MFHKIKHKVGNNLINLRGWRTSRRIVVIESDDWGTVRMPDVKARNHLTSKYPTQTWGDTYDKVDNLANADDLAALYEVLLQFVDKNGNHPVITANTIMANPNFNQIKTTNYQQYSYEPFTETLKHYPSHTGTFEMWKEGIGCRVFKPQLHGREHLNVCKWLIALQNNSNGLRDAFEYGTWLGVLPDKQRLDIAFDYDNKAQLDFVTQALQEAAGLFEQLFGFKSTSYIAPSYTWCDSIEETLRGIGVNTIQSGLVQMLPKAEYPSQKRRHYMGQNNGIGQVYLMRNCHFEPALSSSVDWVGKCFADIHRIFRWHKPVILSSHRLNYIGNLEEQNRSRTLSMLKELLQRIIAKYPDVEFMTSDELGQLILTS